jgi:hypothetical protein
LFGGELQIRFGVDEPLEVIGDAVDPFQTFGDCLVGTMTFVATLSP